MRASRKPDGSVVARPLRDTDSVAPKRGAAQRADAPTAQEVERRRVGYQPLEERSSQLQKGSEFLSALESPGLASMDWATGYQHLDAGNLFIPASEQPENRVAGERLAARLLPQLPAAKEILGGLSDVAILEATSEPPPGRFSKGCANGGDLGFMHEAQRLVDAGVITPRTLVISETGHDIPVLAQLSENSSLRLQGALNLDSSGLQTGSDSRVRDQAQTWGGEIEEHMKASSESGPGAMFVGIEGHRVNPLTRLLSLPRSTPFLWHRPDRLPDRGSSESRVRRQERRPAGRPQFLDGGLG